MTDYLPLIAVIGVVILIASLAQMVVTNRHIADIRKQYEDLVYQQIFDTDLEKPKNDDKPKRKLRLGDDGELIPDDAPELPDGFLVLPKGFHYESRWPTLQEAFEKRMERARSEASRAALRHGYSSNLTEVFRQVAVGLDEARRYVGDQEASRQELRRIIESLGSQAGYDSDGNLITPEQALRNIHKPRPEDVSHGKRDV